MKHALTMPQVDQLAFANVVGDLQKDGPPIGAKFLGRERAIAPASRLAHFRSVGVGYPE